MDKDEIIVNLEFWIDCLENPAYNSLEVGFRHNPLSKDEIINRYKEECEMTRHSMICVLERIKHD